MMMIEGSGSVSMPVANGSGFGSRRPKTYGSDGSGFGSGSASLARIFFQILY
jgi:hypothetical protein